MPMADVINAFERHGTWSPTVVPNIIGSVAEQRYVPVILVLYACVDLSRPHETLPLLC